MKKVGLITSSQFPNLTSDDRLVLEYLQQYRIEAHAAIWDAPTVSWETFDHIILRSPWDYSFRFQEFQGWLNRLEQNNIPISNPYPVLRWNMNKHYLEDLQRKGLAIPVTLWFMKGTQVNLTALLNKQQWGKAVVKPLVSAGGHHAWCATLETAKVDQQRLLKNLGDQDVMIQEFIESISSKGEWSFIFFNKKWSHAVLKRPAPGEFRVQERFGGTVQQKDPPSSLVEQAQKVIDSIEWPLLYARVDGMEEDDRLILMELELLEPALFLGSDPAAPQRFAEAINSIFKSYRL